MPTQDHIHRELDDFAAVVVLYRPDRSVLENVMSYADQVGAVYAVDNSEQPDEGFVAELHKTPNLTYLAIGENLGIATALNRGVEAAVADGKKWLLTMDQDSTATAGMVDALWACARTDPEIGLVSPIHQQVGGARREAAPGCHDVLTAMTSGNLVRASIFPLVGGFMDELFIDQVDNEFCLRLHRHGLRVVETSEAELTHRVGDVRAHRFPYPAYSSNHSPLRRYYIARNRAVVGEMYADDYPEFGAFERRQMLKETVKVVLYEDDKLEKLRMIRRGLRDARAGRLGAYRDPR
jgi:rhamnosyltransferase